MLLLSGFHFLRFIGQRTLRARVTSCLSQPLISTPNHGIDHTLGPPERDHFMTERHQKNLPLLLATDSNELSVSLLKILCLFLILINLALAVMDILHFDLLNKLSLESGIQRFISFMTFQALTLCFFSLHLSRFSSISCKCTAVCWECLFIPVRFSWALGSSLPVTKPYGQALLTAFTFHQSLRHSVVLSEIAFQLGNEFYWRVLIMELICGGEYWKHLFKSWIYIPQSWPLCEWKTFGGNFGMLLN